MNATNFVVLLIFVGVVCANVGARQLEEVSKETKLGISISKTATTNGIGAELDRVDARTSAYNSEYSNANVAEGPGSSGASASGSVYKNTSGSVTAEGPRGASASSGSSVSSSTNSRAAAGPGGAEGSASTSGNAGSGANGISNRP